MFWDMGLHEKGAPIRIQSTSDVDNGSLKDSIPHRIGIEVDGNGVVINDTIDTVIIIDQGDPVLNSPEIVPNVDFTRWLNPAKNPLHLIAPLKKKAMGNPSPMASIKYLFPFNHVMRGPGPISSNIFRHQLLSTFSSPATTLNYPFAGKMSMEIPPGVSSILSRTPLFMSEICWRSGIPAEGQQAAISEGLLPGFPGANIKEFWLTILSEAKRSQI
jgi:hypothetical protein